ncbi:MAG: small nucleolar ribonucleoprotein [Methanothermococcus sp.]|uniref:rRNA maturation protein n=1 Tax=Methanothermococcus sp. TaxID=2614238 RepID=UPI00258E8862|nr:rRNA maturation protein [Methanothermococcus sp.]MDK2790190.1 small nucleolar ribonucleoprotein [Methanothermococcus sp.]
MIITTSRKPSQRTRSFVKDLASVLGIKILNRGKTPLKDILETYDNFIVVEEFKGNPGKLKFYNTKKNEVLSLIIATKLQKEVCGENVGMIKKLGAEFDKSTSEYKNVFYDFLFKNLDSFDELNEDDNESSFKVGFKKSSKDDNIFYIQFYKGDKELGPLIKVKSVKIIDIES